ncbi:phage tail protein [Vibrio sp. S4M6]|uniref:phage tail protein n=1 Tax=Vibrio sinus TaxID=2946865 RepID=UPI00202AA87D|nr:phage tail protein [Vibrio sinus]
MTPQLILGDFPFTVASQTQYEGLVRASSSGWKKQGRVGQKPKKHLSEIPLDRITLKGKWFGENAESAMTKLRNMRFEPHVLSNSQGINLGFWTIESITENQKRIGRDGLAQIAEFTIVLEESPDE